MISAAQLKQIFPQCRDPGMWARILLPAAKEFGIADNPGEFEEWLVQIGHESAHLNRLVENLNYSARGLMATWPKWFPDLETATKYARQPDKIANYVYAGRMGNMEPGSGDGYRYRGRGLIQITGRTNYEACGKGIGQPLLSFPQKLEDPIQAARSAAWYWRSRNLDAVVGDIEADTKAVNGGLTGIEDRKALYTKAKEVLGV